MELKINFNQKAIEDSVQQQFQQDLTRSTRNAADQMVGALMASEHRDHHGRVLRPEGYVRTLIRSKLEAYVTSDAFEKHIQEVIEKQMAEAAEEGVRAMLRSAARRRVFEAVPYQKET